MNFDQRHQIVAFDYRYGSGKITMDQELLVKKYLKILEPILLQILLLELLILVSNYRCNFINPPQAVLEGEPFGSRNHGSLEGFQLDKNIILKFGEEKIQKRSRLI